MGPYEYKTVYFRRVDGKWDWRVVARNGKQVGSSSNQGYENHADAVAMANAILNPMIARNFELDTSAWDAAADERHQLSDKGGNDT